MNNTQQHEEMNGWRWEESAKAWTRSVPEKEEELVALLREWVGERLPADGGKKLPEVMMKFAAIKFVEGSAVVIGQDEDGQWMSFE